MEIKLHINLISSDLVSRMRFLIGPAEVRRYNADAITFKIYFFITSNNT